MAWAAIDPASKMLAIGAAPSEHALAKQIPGCNHNDHDGIWRAPLSWASYVIMRTVWGSFPLTESAELAGWAASKWGDVQTAYHLRASVDAPDGLKTEIAMIEASGDDVGQLRKFQRGGTAWLVLQQRAGLFDPQGNGKCPQSIRALQVLRQRGEQGPALIIAAGAMLYDWQDEIAKFAPELSVQVVSGSALKRRRALLDRDQVADAYVIAWDVLRLHTRLAAYPGQRFVRCAVHGGTDSVTTGRCEVHDKELNDPRFRWLAVIADEAHRMKDAKSKWTRAVWHLAHHAPYFWPMTGTPIGDDVGDIWPPGHGIDPREFPAKSRFLDMFAMQELAWHKGREILGLRPDHADAFHMIVQPVFRRIPRDVARPDQPPRLDPVTRSVELSPGQAKAYRQLRKEALAELGPGETTVPANTAVKFSRLCQLAYATLRIEDGEDAAGFTTQVHTPVLPSSKADDLIDFLADEDPGDSLVVYCNSPRLAEMCERKLDEAKITHCKIVGGMTAEAKSQSTRWFQDGQCRVILITAAGSESVTLTRASTVLMLQPNPSYLATEQIIGRVDRIGQEFPVRVVYSLSVIDGRPTVDHRLYHLSQEKMERSAQVLRDPQLMRWIIEGEDNDTAEPAGTEPAGADQTLF